MGTAIPKSGNKYNLDTATIDHLVGLYGRYCDDVMTGLIVGFIDYLAPLEHARPQFGENAMKILSERYLLKDPATSEPFENAHMFLCRIAVGIQRQDDVDYDEITYLKALEFYELMANLEFLPNSPTLMNAGTKMGQLSACFVVPVEDDIDGIFDAVKGVAKIHKSGGGTGMNFSKLRQKDARVGSTGGVASGPISFMQIFDVATEQIKQGGKRRGANMGMLRVDHPDVIEFIKCKDDNVSLQNFNISVALTAEFMSALSGTNDTVHGIENFNYAIRDPRTNEIVEWKDAREVWNLIVDHAWGTGDPGIVFIDRINDDSPFDLVRFPEHTIEATNPCGEQPLESWEACNLGSINLTKFISETPTDSMLTDGQSIWPIDAESLKAVVRKSVEFLDNVVTASIFPMPEIQENVRKNRKIGLGVMGWADLLIALGIRYGSDESYRLARTIMAFVNGEAHSASQYLANQRGMFPSFDESIFDHPMRNATVTTIAPTGTLSMLAECSSGVEPVFALAFTKTVMDDKVFKYTQPTLQKIVDNGGVADGDLENLLVNGIPPVYLLETFPELVTAMSITPEQHVRMQAAFQEHTDNAVSKTVNLTADATREDIDRIYRLAYDTDCKGITIFRDGCKGTQVLTVGTKDESPVDDVPVQVEEDFDTDPRQAPLPVETSLVKDDADFNPMVDRPEALVGYTIKLATGCGNMYVTISEDENGQPMEIFARLGKSGGCANASAETCGRIVSKWLRAGGEPYEMVKQLRGTNCGNSAGFGANRVLSCQDAVGIALERYLSGRYHIESIREFEEETPIQEQDTQDAGNGKYYQHSGACPSCGGPMENEGGCAVCKVCAFSKCA